MLNIFKKKGVRSKFMMLNMGEFVDGFRQVNKLNHRAHTQHFPITHLELCSRLVELQNRTSGRLNDDLFTFGTDFFLKNFFLVLHVMASEHAQKVEIFVFWIEFGL